MGENKEKEYVLAMYDIRGKQNYIYKSRKMKEIVGASLIIRDCFLDYLFPAAREVSAEGGQTAESKGIYSYREDPEKTDFSESGFEKHIEEGYIGEVIYDGGGNFFVLYKNLEIYQKVNKKFYVKLLKGTYSLRVLTSYIDRINFDDYAGDVKRLRAKHRENERRECVMAPVNALPIVQMDPLTCMPLADKQAQGREHVKVSAESKAKYDKYLNGADKYKEGARVLDDMVEKGVDSHLAVIYIDGNSMGAKVQGITENKSSYKDCAAALRAFSERIQEEYIDGPMREIDKAFADDDKRISERYAQDGKAVDEDDPRMRRRFVIYAGDEITFVCNAKDAYSIVKTYFEALKGEKLDEVKNSSCAGVAIFHSHAPFADAYRIAEECCETGKKWMKEYEIENACYLDFHYCQGAIGTSLKDIREHEGTKDMCKPWLLDGSEENTGVPDDKKSPAEAEIEEMEVLLNQIARTNGKTLLFAAKDNKEAFETELLRIKAHTPDKAENTDACIDVKKKIDEILGEGKESALKEKIMERNRALIYRMMLVYDLWFRNGTEEKTEGGEQA